LVLGWTWVVSLFTFPLRLSTFWLPTLSIALQKIADCIPIVKEFIITYLSIVGQVLWCYCFVLVVLGFELTLARQALLTLEPSSSPFLFYFLPSVASNPHPSIYASCIAWITSMHITNTGHTYWYGVLLFVWIGLEPQFSQSEPSSWDYYRSMLSCLTSVLF
jgi:hypothetical protein